MFINWQNQTFLPLVSSKSLHKLPSDFRLYQNGVNYLDRNALGYIIVMDLETSDLILSFQDTNLQKFEKIPRILQFGCIVFSIREFFDEKSKKRPLPLDTVDESDISPSKLFKIIENLMTQYPKAVFVAHNGIAFDFKIIISYLLLLFKNKPEISKSIVESLMFVDTLPAIKALKFHCCKNTELYKNICINVDADLLNNAHEAVADCLITSNWLWKMRYEIKLESYSTFNNLVALYSYVPHKNVKKLRVNLEKIKIN